MNHIHAGRTVEAAIFAPVPADSMWRAWTDPELLSQWYTDRATGKPEAGATYTWAWDQFGPPMSLAVARAIPGRLLVLESSHGSIEVHVSGEEEGSRVQVVHSGLPEDSGFEEIYRGCVSGWKMALAVLAHYLENYFEQSKQCILIMRSAGFEYEAAYERFADREKLALWFQSVGSPGLVLAATGQEVCYRWDAAGGVLECKAFGSSRDDRKLALRATSWSREYDMSGIRQDLEDSLDRLEGLLLS